MNYALSCIVHPEFGNIVGYTIMIQCIHLQAGNRIFYTLRPVSGWDVVISYRQNGFLAP